MSLSLPVQGQGVLKTIVPKQPVMVGESFQVQYVLEGGVLSDFKEPAFPGFRLVTGPNVYKGSVEELTGGPVLINTVYTLEPLKPGRFIIKGAEAVVNGKAIQSKDATVAVISREEAAYRSPYFLRPGENPLQKVKQNVFLKVTVDKPYCYAGQPVLATFKLYSRLQSRSEIIKNPGFYGFTVHDMVSLADKMVTTEKINGNLFDVHTIRKVQLFPLQEGDFVIDAMELKNRVEFSRSVINKKTEQEIVEGLFGGGDSTPEPDADKEIVETVMRTAPVTVHVQALPETGKPAYFDGAVGHFLITSRLLKDKLARNEEGLLEISISGAGNFMQLNAPEVQWPEGIESFEPQVQDSLDLKISPVSGQRTVRYAFVSVRPDRYVIPPVTIAFFNPEDKSYKTISTKELEFTITNREKKENIAVTTGSKEKKRTAQWGWAGIILLGIVISAVFLRARQKKDEAKEAGLVPEKTKEVVSIDDLLLPATALSKTNDRQFYDTLSRSVWDYFKESLGISGSAMNKTKLFQELRSKGIDRSTITLLESVLKQCEAEVFTRAELGTDKKQLLGQARKTLETIQKHLL